MLVDVPRGFYVYVLIDPSTGGIFYVGKGKGGRIGHHETEARKKCKCIKCKKIRGIWEAGREVKRAIVFISNDEQAAYDYEARLVAEIGLHHLTNAVPGGGKGVGYVMPDLPLSEMPEREYVRFLRGLQLTKKEFNRTLQEWRSRKLHMLTDYRRRKTMFGRKPDTTEIDAEIERLTIVLGYVIQYRLEDAEGYRL